MKLYITNHKAAVDLLGIDRQKELHSTAWKLLMDSLKKGTIPRAISVENYVYHFQGQEANTYKYKIKLGV